MKIRKLTSVLAAMFITTAYADNDTLIDCNKASINAGIKENELPEEGSGKYKSPNGGIAEFATLDGRSGIRLRGRLPELSPTGLERVNATNWDLSQSQKYAIGKCILEYKNTKKKTIKDFRGWRGSDGRYYELPEL